MASTEGLTYPDFFHKETTNGTYLPNEEDNTCGASAAFGQIVCPRGQDCDSKQGAYPFIAALGNQYVTKNVYILEPFYIIASNLNTY